MSYTYFDRLSSIDAALLGVESADTHFEIGAVCIFDAEPLAAAEGGVDFDRIRDLVESKLHRVPRFRQRIARIPISGHPVWVDDARFNLLYHLRHAALPRPGSERQLKRLVGRILSQPLDRTKPLWEIWVVEGLEGDRFALVAKVHHCMVDGSEGVGTLMATFISPNSTSTVGEIPRWLPRPAPRALDLVGAAIRRPLSQGGELLRSAMRTARNPRHSIESLRETTTSLFETIGESEPTSPTVLNQPIGPHRRFDWLRMPLDEVKELKRPFGGTVNDVVLALTAGALRSFLSKRGEDVRALTLRVTVPVNTRRAEQVGAAGNVASVFSVRLPVHLSDPAERLRFVIDETRRAKRSKQARIPEMIAELSEWAPVNLYALVMMAAAGNSLGVTNVPGPPFACYLLDAPMLETYPVIPLFKTSGLNIGLFSYNGSLLWGFDADWDNLPDLHEFVDAVATEFDALRKTAVEAPPNPEA